MTFPNILLIFFLTKKFGYMKYYSYLCTIPDKDNGKGWHSKGVWSVDSNLPYTLVFNKSPLFIVTEHPQILNRI